MRACSSVKPVRRGGYELIATSLVQQLGEMKDRRMRSTAWVWFVGCAAWIGDGVVHVRLHSLPHAKLAFMVALVFFVAGLFYRNQKT